ncbi:MAG: Uma2 family endonuclease [Bacteroidia bacterium]|nr:Uma2 family endonuclease [Bacteroidia bacterium]
MAVELKKRKISREAYHVMIDAGIFGPEDKIELLNGEIIDMSPIASPHMSAVNRLTHLFSLALSGSAIVSVQNPLNLGEFSEPEPDLAIFKFQEDFYENAIPTANDVLLLIEVADTTLKKDREIKLPLYAAAGIPFLWIVDLENRQIEEYSHPVNGIYQNRLICRKGDVLILEELDIEIMFDDILP